MAKWFFTCQQTLIIVCLCLIFPAPVILGEIELDDRLVYEVVGRNIIKRDTNNATMVKPSEVTGSSEKPTTSPPKKVVSIPVKPAFEPVVKNFTKNLGENGHGIRLNITSTTRPPLVDPIIKPNEKSGTTVSVNKSIVTDAHNDSDDPDAFAVANPSDLDTEEGGKKFNESLSKHNVTSSKTDPNLFYNTSIYDDPNIGHFYWVDMDNRTDVKVNELLSQSHRRAATVKLSFNFPFYGHLIKNVTIATGGFLYTGDYVHSWLAATQYIAPLMANFDTSLSNESFIKYVDNGTAFTVEWEKVTLQDKPDDGEFTFQVTLFNNGDIVFVYKHVPLLVDQIQELHHPVKVGLSDAYIMDQTVFLVRRKTIYEYDRVHFNKTYIKNWTTIVLRALPTCLDATDCNTCLTRKLNFKCFWCPAMSKCSQGYDRHRQNWLANACDKNSFNNVSVCSAVYQTDNTAYVFDHNDADQLPPNKMSLAHKMVNPNPPNEVGMSGVVAILFLVAMVSGLSFWVFYAYRNPHTFSGQILIRYRPSQWRWRRGEARYTAATIHM
ncbi:plexin domain-containing protein 2 [Diabrotica virgifera virgifera]|uniref:Plexin domain-containing protein 2 n=1 Tax=Diabrotica virgifera virgifera TaxID=50390 RepID=A0A6P7EXR2_DIAVI|nr:plexin domain-containing protein 2 [Diabrotica virgifera virgifera]